MITEISNKVLTCKVDSKGAQLVSLVAKNGHDYIWCGDSSIWKWHAPVLFPFCGNFPNGFAVEGKTYHLPQHGFLRDVEHRCISNGVFEYNTDGIADYPYAFKTVTSFGLSLFIVG